MVGLLQLQGDIGPSLTELLWDGTRTAVLLIAWSLWILFGGRLAKRNGVLHADLWKRFFTTGLLLVFGTWCLLIRQLGGIPFTPD